MLNNTLLEKFGNIECYYSKLLLSIEDLTTAFYKFLYQFNKLNRILTDPSEFNKQDYSDEYVDSKVKLEEALLTYRKYVEDPNYGFIRTTTINVEYGYSAFRIVQSEKRVMQMIDAFNVAYTNKNMGDESYAYAGLSYLESVINTVSIVLSRTAEIYPVPVPPENKEEDESVEGEGVSDPVEITASEEKDSDSTDTNVVDMEDKKSTRFADSKDKTVKPRTNRK